MTDAVETMAYANEVPWHGLGNAVTNKLSPAQMLKAAGLDWTVSKRPMYFADKNGKMELSKSDMALCRDSDDVHLTTVGMKYKPVQNEAAFDFFKKWVVGGHMDMETAGSLWGGRYVWGLARIGADFALGKGSNEDKVRSYLLLASPHVHGKALVIQYTPIRVVCWNTLSWALGANLKGNESAFRVPHSMVFNDAVKAEAELALGLAKEEASSFKEAVILLSKKKAKPEVVEDFFCEVLRFDPSKLDKKKDGEAREPRMLPKFRAALEYAPGQQLPSALGTWWGAVNAVTYVIDHETGRGDRSTSLKNAWLGHTAGIKRRALDLALKNAA